MSVLIRDNYCISAGDNGYCRKVVKPKQYVELREVVSQNGLEEKYVTVDYPHTPEMIKSYANIADYRHDPFNAVANSVPRTNLGDVREVQKFAQMDTAEKRAFLEKVKTALETLENADKVVGDVSQNVETDTKTDTQSEVKNNG